MNTPLPPNRDDFPDRDIRSLMRKVQLPNVDLDQLAEDMRSSMHGPLPNQSPQFAWVPKLAWAATFLLGVCLIYTLYLITASTQSVNTFQIVSQSSDSQPSWLWYWKLKHGYSVTTPANTTVELTLADESVVTCKGSTKLSVQFNGYRTIKVDEGSIEVHAAKNPDYPMRVVTPLGTVHVTGTVFHVELINQDDVVEHELKR